MFPLFQASENHVRMTRSAFCMTASVVRPRVTASGKTAPSPYPLTHRGEGNPHLVLHHEALDAFAGVDFARVDIAEAVGRDHMNPMEAAPGMSEEAEMAERPAARAIHDPHHIVHDVGDV